MGNTYHDEQVHLADLSFLIIDDDPVVLQLARKILNAANAASVESAYDGLEALNKIHASTSPYDVIICDLKMPGMNGVEFMKHISKSSYSGGILLLSGGDDRLLESASELARAYQLNVIGSIGKEQLVHDLLNTIVYNYVPGGLSGMQFTPLTISEEELRQGLAGSALVPYFQPVIEIKSGNIVGVEILSRWQHAEKGILSPASFIPLAESSGLIHELTFRVFEMAVSWIRQWQQLSPYLHCSVNISANSLGMPKFYNFIINCLDEYELDPGRMILEVTEREIMTDITQSLTSLMSLRMQNIGLSIDDFGTGYSSMEKLKMIPFTELKLDRSFVTDATNSPSARVILESSVALARKLKMEIVAEGVETRADWDMVNSLQCDYVQGFYCASPMPAEDFPDFYRDWNGPHLDPAI